MTAQDWLKVARITIEAKDYCFIPFRIELMSIFRNVVPDPRTRPAVLVREGDAWVIPSEK